MFYLIKFKILTYLYFFSSLIWYVKYKNKILLKFLINIILISYNYLKSYIIYKLLFMTLPV